MRARLPVGGVLAWAFRGLGLACLIARRVGSVCVVFEAVNLVLVRLWALRLAVGAHNPHGMIACLTDNRSGGSPLDTGQRSNGGCSWTREVGLCRV
jgi:hypothetical protein